MTVAEESDPNAEEGETAGAEEEDDEPEETQTEVMEVTPLHPIYVEGEGWLNAENLEAGDTLRLADGGMAKVLAIEHQQLSTPAVVYTFTVATFHTYFVLDLQLLVHNITINCGKNMQINGDLTIGNLSYLIQTLDGDGTLIDTHGGINTPHHFNSMSENNLENILDNDDLEAIPNLNVKAETELELNILEDLYINGDVTLGNVIGPSPILDKLQEEISPTTMPTNIIIHQNPQGVSILADNLEVNGITGRDIIAGEMIDDTGPIAVYGDTLSKPVQISDNPTHLTANGYIEGHHLVAPQIIVYSSKPPVPALPIKSNAQPMCLKVICGGHIISGSSIRSQTAIHYIGNLPSGSVLQGDVFWKKVDN